MSKIKSFRGKIASGTQDTIVLHTNNGSTGYRIVKFSLFPVAPGDGSAADIESIVKIFSVKQSTIDGNVDFSDNTLLAAGYLIDSNSVANTTELITVFDNMTFNQDIHVTALERLGSIAVNYYIELEQFKLDLNDNTMATLKDIRNETLAL